MSMAWIWEFKTGNPKMEWFTNRWKWAKICGCLRLKFWPIFNIILTWALLHVVDTFNLGTSSVLLCRLVAAMAKKDTKETKDRHILRRSGILSRFQKVLPQIHQMRRINGSVSPTHLKVRVPKFLKDKDPITWSSQNKNKQQQLMN